MTTATNVNEISNLEEVLQRADLPENIPVKVAKGYQSRKNADLLAKRNLKNHMLKKLGGISPSAIGRGNSTSDDMLRFIRAVQTYWNAKIKKREQKSHN